MKKTLNHFRAKVNEHIVSVELGRMLFNALTAFQTKIKSTHGQMLHLEDSFGKDIHITRSRRIGLYNNSILVRVQRLQQYYGTHELELNPTGIVVDIGANLGEFGLFYSRKFHPNYDCHVVFFEPDPVEFAALSKNVSKTNHTAVCKALWKEKGELTFYHSNETGDSTLIKPHTFDSTSTLMTSTLDFELEQLKNLPSDSIIDLIKVEAEGAEPEILQGAISTLKRTKYVVVDCGPERGLKKESTLMSTVHFLQEQGFLWIHFTPGRYSALFKNERNSESG